MRLSEYIEAESEVPFDWRSHNCVHFTAGWVNHIEGGDVLAGLADSENMLDAHRKIRGLGGIENAVSNRLGRKPIPTSMAQQGDVVMVIVGEDQTALGLCAGRTAALLQEDQGIVHVTMGIAISAWAIGRPK